MLVQIASDEWRRITVDPSKQAHECRARRVAVAEPKRGYEQHAQDGGSVECFRSQAFAGTEQLQPFLIESVETLRQELLNQRFLAAEVIIHCSKVGTGSGRDVAQRHGFVALFDKQPFRRVQQSLPRIGVAVSLGLDLAQVRYPWK